MILAHRLTKGASIVAPRIYILLRNFLLWV